MIINRKVVGGGGGGTDYLQYAKSVSLEGATFNDNIDITIPRATSCQNMFKSATMPQKTKVTAMSATNLQTMFDSATFPVADSEVEIHAIPTGLTGVYRLFKGGSDRPIAKLTLDFDTSTCTGFEQFLNEIGTSSAYCQVISNLDFSGLTSAMNCYIMYGAYISSIGIKENCLSVSMSYAIGYSGFFGDSVFVSFANALIENAGGASLTYKIVANTAGKTNAIIGRVERDETDTYDRFVQDSTGTVTLTDFITNTKGWSIA